MPTLTLERIPTLSSRRSQVIIPTILHDERHPSSPLDLSPFLFSYSLSLFPTVEQPHSTMDIQQAEAALKKFRLGKYALPQGITPGTNPQAEHLYHMTQALRDASGGTPIVQALAQIPTYQQALLQQTIPTEKFAQVNQVLAQLERREMNESQATSALRQLATTPVTSQLGQLSQNLQFPTSSRQEREARISAVGPRIGAWQDRTAQNSGVPLDKIKAVFKSFSDEQLAAVEAPDQTRVIKSGGGGGKTDVVVAMITDAVVNRGARATDFTVLVATHSAEGELVRRLTDIGNTIPAMKLDWAGQVKTFHSKAMSTLNQRVMQASGQAMTPLQAMGMGAYTPFPSSSSSSRKVAPKNAEEAHQAQMKEEFKYFQNLLTHHGVRVQQSANIFQQIQAIKAEHGYDGPYKDMGIAGSQSWAAGKKDAFESLLYMYEKARMNDPQFKLPSQTGPHYDLADTIILAARAGERGKTQQWKHTVVDEMQDPNRQMYRMLAAQTQKSTGFRFFAGDEGQRTIKSGGSYQAGQAIQQMFPSAKAFPLTGNYRLGPINTAMYSATQMEHVLDNRGRAPFQVSMRQGGTEAFPSMYTATSFKQVNEQMFADYLQRQGLSHTQVASNITSGAHPLSGASSPGSMPFVFQMKDQRRYFLKTVEHVLAQKVGPAKAKVAMRQMFNQGTPQGTGGTTAHALLVNQTLGKSFPHVFADWTRVGSKWSDADYMEQMGVVASRPTVQSHIYSSQTNIAGSNYNLAPDTLHGQAVPTGMATLYQWMLHNLTGVQGFSPSSLSRADQQLLSSPMASRTQAPARDLSSFQGFVEDTIKLIPYARPAAGAGIGTSAIHSATSVGVTASSERFGDESTTVNGISDRGSFQRILGTAKPEPDMTRIGLIVGYARNLLQQGGEVTEDIESLMKSGMFGYLSGGEKKAANKQITDYMAETTSDDWSPYFNEKSRLMSGDHDRYSYRGKDEQKLRQGISDFLGSDLVREHPQIKPLIEGAFTRESVRNVVADPKNAPNTYERQVFTTSPVLKTIQDYAYAQRSAALQHLLQQVNAAHEQGGLDPFIRNLVNNPKDDMLREEILNKAADVISFGYLPPEAIEAIKSAAEDFNYPTLTHLIDAYGDTLYSADNSQVGLRPVDMDYIKANHPREHALLSALAEKSGVDLSNLEDPAVQKQLSMLPHVVGQMVRSAGEKGQSLGIPIAESAFAPFTTEMSALSHNLEKAGILDPMAMRSGSIDDILMNISPEMSQAILHPIGGFDLRKKKVVALPGRFPILEQDALLGGLSPEELEVSLSLPSQSEGVGVGLEGYQKRLENLLSIQGHKLSPEQAQGYRTELEQVRELRKTLGDPSFHLESGHLLNMVHRAATGESAIDKNVKDEHNQPYARFMAPLKNQFGEGSRTLGSIGELVSSLQEGISHVQGTGMLSRTHTNRILEALGHDPSEFGTLSDLESLAGFGEVSSIPLTALAGQFPSEQSNLLSQFTRFPFKQGQTAAFMGGMPGFTDIAPLGQEKAGLQTGMVGTLHPINKGISFGLPTDYGDFRKHGLFTGEEWKEHGPHAQDSEFLKKIAEPLAMLHTRNRSGEIQKFPVRLSQMSDLYAKGLHPDSQEMLDISRHNVLSGDIKGAISRRKQASSKIPSWLTTKRGQRYQAWIAKQNEPTPPALSPSAVQFRKGLRGFSSGMPSYDLGSHPLRKLNQVLLPATAQSLLGARGFSLGGVSIPQPSQLANWPLSTTARRPQRKGKTLQQKKPVVSIPQIARGIPPGTFSYHTGDIFESFAQTLVNTTNLRTNASGEAIMGAGLAKQMAARFPGDGGDDLGIVKSYGADIRARRTGIGRPTLYESGNEDDPFVLNFPTKDDWRHPSRLEYIDRGMQHLVQNAGKMGISSIAFPKLGTQNGGLSWDKVGPLMMPHISKLLSQGIDVEMYTGEGDTRYMPELPTSSSIQEGGGKSWITTRDTRMLHPRPSLNVPPAHTPMDEQDRKMYRNQLELRSKLFTPRERRLIGRLYPAIAAQTFGGGASALSPSLRAQIEGGGGGANETEQFALVSNTPPPEAFMPKGFAGGSLGAASPFAQGPILGDANQKRIVRNLQNVIPKQLKGLSGEKLASFITKKQYDLARSMHDVAQKGRPLDLTAAFIDAFALQAAQKQVGQSISSLPPELAVHTGQITHPLLQQLLGEFSLPKSSIRNAENLPEEQVSLPPEVPNIEAQLDGSPPPETFRIHEALFENTNAQLPPPPPVPEVFSPLPPDPHAQLKQAALQSWRARHPKNPPRGFLPSAQQQSPSIIPDTQSTTPPPSLPEPLPADQLEALAKGLREGNSNWGIHPPSDEQKKYMLDPARRTVLEGGPGTGKTATGVRGQMYQVATGAILPRNTFAFSAIRSATSRLAGEYGKYRKLLPKGKDYDFPIPRTFASIAASTVLHQEHDPIEHKDYFPMLQKLGYKHLTGEVMGDPTAQDLYGKDEETQIKMMKTSQKALLTEQINASLQAQGKKPWDKDSQALRDAQKYIGDTKKGRMGSYGTYEQIMRGEKVAQEPYTHGIQKGLKDLAAGNMTQEAVLVLHEQGMRKKGGMDWDDLFSIATEAYQKFGPQALPHVFKQIEAILVDEGQDVNPLMASLQKHFIGALSANNPHVTVAMDVMQSLTQGMGGIPMGEIRGSYRDILGIPEATPFHQLTQNFRSDAGTVAFHNALLASPHLGGLPHSPAQVARSGNVGKPTKFLLGKTQPEVYQQMFRSRLAATGLPLATIKQNIKSGQHPFTGATLLPKEIATILPRNQDVDLFTHVAKQELQTSLGLGEHEASHVFSQMMRQGMPPASLQEHTPEWEQAQMQMPLLKFMGSRGNEYQDVAMDASLVGAWQRNEDIPGHLRNLFVGGTRTSAGGQTTIGAAQLPFNYAEAERYMQGGGINLSRMAYGKRGSANTFEDFQGQQVPRFFRDLSQGAHTQLQQWGMNPDAGRKIVDSSLVVNTQNVKMNIPPGGSVSIQGTNVQAPGGINIVKGSTPPPPGSKWARGASPGTNYPAPAPASASSSFNPFAPPRRGGPLGGYAGSGMGGQGGPGGSNTININATGNPPPPGGSGGRSGGGYNNAYSQFGRSMARLGYELQFMGQYFGQIVTSALQQGSEYRLATGGLPGSGPTGTEGFYDFTSGSGIASYQTSTLPMYSNVQVAQGIQNLYATTGYRGATPPLGSLTDVMGLAAITGMDPTQLMGSMAYLSGSSGQGQNMSSYGNMTGMLTNLFGNTLTSANVTPTLSALSSIVPTLNGISPGGGSQTGQAMAFFQLAQNAGMTPQNFGDVSSLMGSLTGIGTAPNLQQQYTLSKLGYPLTADTALTQYQQEQTGREIQIASLGLQQNINEPVAGINGGRSTGSPLSLPQLQIQVDQAQITMDKANLTMSGIQLQAAQVGQQGAELQYQYGQASYGFNLAMQNALYGPIGKDYSQLAGYSFQQNQLVAQRNSTSPEIGTMFTPQGVSGLRNQEFYAGLQNQQQSLILGRSPLLSDALFQQQMKYIAQQADFYKQELALRNQQREFDMVWQKRLLDQQGAQVAAQGRIVAYQGYIYSLQQDQFKLEVEKNLYDQKQAAIAQQYLGQQLGDLDAINLALSQFLNGQGPVGGQNLQPQDLVQKLADELKSGALDPSTLQSTIRGLGMSPQDQSTMYQLVTQLSKQPQTLAQMTQNMNGANDKQLLDLFNQLKRNGAFNIQVQQVGQQNAALQQGGVGANWDQLTANTANIATAESTIAKVLAPGTPFLQDISTIANIVGPLAVGVGTLANVMGLFLKLNPGGFGFGTGGGAPGVPGVGNIPGSPGGPGNSPGSPDYTDPGAYGETPIKGPPGTPGGGNVPFMGAGMYPDAPKIPSYTVNSLQQLQKLQGSAQTYTVKVNGKTYMTSDGGKTFNDISLEDPLHALLNILGITHNQVTFTPAQMFSQGKPPGGPPPQQDSSNSGPPVTPAQQIAMYAQYAKPGGPGTVSTQEANTHLKNMEGYLHQVQTNTGNIDNKTKTGVDVQTTSKAHLANIAALHTQSNQVQARQVLIQKNSDNTLTTSNNTNTANKVQLANIATLHTASNQVQARQELIAKNSDGTLTTSSGTQDKIRIDNDQQVKGMLTPAMIAAGIQKGFQIQETPVARGGVTSLSHPGFITPGVNAEFHQKMNYGIHQGVDFAAGQGTPIGAFNMGRVTGAGFYPWGGEVDVDIGNGLTERYLHLSQIGVVKGQPLLPRERIGLTGGGTPASGLGYWSSGAHSHVQIDQGNINAGLNPWPLWAMLGSTNIASFYQAGWGTTKGGAGGAKQLAEGGIAMKRVMAEIGEGKEPEAVLPLSKLSALLKSASETSSHQASSPHKTVHVGKLAEKFEIHVHTTASKLDDHAIDELGAQIFDILTGELQKLH